MRVATRRCPLVMTDRPKLTYHPQDAWVDDGRWFGLDGVHLDGQRVGTRLASARVGGPVTKLQVSLPQAELLLTFVRSVHGENFEALAAVVVEAAARSVHEFHEGGECSGEVLVPYRR